MRDPRLVEIEFLSALDQELPSSLSIEEWAKRLQISDEFCRDMIFALFLDGCLEGGRSINLDWADLQGAAPPAAGYGRQLVNASVRTLLVGGQRFPAYVNHAGRLRLHRLKDEIFEARHKGEFDLGLAKRHWNSDLVVNIATKLAAEPAAVIFIDADKFKDVNDKAGHTVGDDVIRIILQSTTTIAGARGGETYHWGGDEVSVYLQGVAPAACEALAEAIRADIENACARHPKLIEKGVTATVSVGVFSFAGRPTPEDLTARASAAMKAAKAKGRNQVVSATFDFAGKGG